MLDELLEKNIEPILERYQKIEMQLILDLVKRFKTYQTVGGVIEHQIKRLDDMGALTRETRRLIANLSGKSEQDIENAIESVIKGSVQWKELSKAHEQGLARISPTDVKMLDLVQDHKDVILEQMRILETRMPQDVNKKFSQMLDILESAQLEAGTYIVTPDQAIYNALDRLADEGITQATYIRNGKEVNYSIEGIVRRTVATELVQGSNRFNQRLIEEMGAEYVRTSQHLGARNKGIGHQNHDQWQNKVFKLRGSDTYPNFAEKTGYGLVDGCGGINCRHTHQAFFPEFSILPDDLDDSQKDLYELTQKQRSHERLVRNAKKRIQIAEEYEDVEYLRQSKRYLIKRQKALREFVKDNGLVREYSRERIVEL